MKISDFFLKQNIKEIQQQFKNVGLNKYYNVPQSVEEWCEKFNLEDDGIISYMFVIKRFSNAEVYIHVNLPNPEYPTCPIVFEMLFNMQTGKNCCKIQLSRVMGFNERTVIFKKVLNTFDNRPKFNEVECEIFLSYLNDVAESHVNEFNRTSYKLKSSKTTVWEVYESLCRLITDMSSTINCVIENFENGNFEKIWNRLEPKNKWNLGNEQLKKMFFGITIKAWHRIRKAGIGTNFEDFVRLYIAITLHHNKDLLVLLKEPTDEEVEQVFNTVISGKE